MLEDQIVDCPKCGGKNRIPGGAVAAAAKARCGHCGTSLSASSIDEAAGIREAVIEPAPKPRGQAGRWISGIILSVLATGAYWFFTSQAGQPTFDSVATTEMPTSDPAAALDLPPPEPVIPFEPAPEPAPIFEPDPTFIPFPETAEEPILLEPAPAPLEPVYVTPGIVNNWTGAEPVAPFTLVTSPGQDYYVKLVYTGTSTEAVSLYVQGGTTSDFVVPLGSYEMRYASGITWYGVADLFGPDTIYSKAGGSFDFVDAGDSYTGYTVELILQEGGNLDTYGIGASEF